MIQRFLILLISALPLIGTGQDISFSVGYGSYDMGGLKGRQQRYVDQYYGKPKVLDNFPGYLYYDVAIGIPIVKRFSLGLAVSSHSTGGRVHYADRSGEVLVDHFVKGTLVAIHPRVKVINNPSHSLLLYAKDGLVFSKARYTEKYVLTGITQSYREDSGTGLAASLEFGLIATKKILPWVDVHLLLGYHSTLSPAEISLDDPNNYDNKFTCDWSGIRASAGIQLSIPRSK